MSRRSIGLTIALAVGLVTTLASAQHEAHQMSEAPSPELTQCLRVQPVIQNVITAAMARAEAARLSNNPAELRAAVDHLEAALRDVRAQSEPCATAAGSSDPHVGHTMPGMQPTPRPAAAPRPAAGDPHTGHATPGAAKAPATPKSTSRAPSKPAAPDAHAGHAKSAAAPAAKPTPSAKPAPPKRQQEAAADPHAGHGGRSAADDSGKQMDPVNGLMVDPATAPKTTFQGHTYYFSSEQSRKEFLESPMKFAKKPKG